MPVPARPDHVSIAVPDVETACRRWVEHLGGGLVSSFHARPVFRGLQVRFANGAKLEMIQPSELGDPRRNFLHRFLDRFGAGVHHVTLLVPHLAAAVETLREAGLDVVDVDDRGRFWKEAFLRPSQVGGLVVQIAWADSHDPDAVPRPGFAPTEPRPDAPALHGPVLTHTDPQESADLWSLLGADIVGNEQGFTARWGDSPFRVRVEPGPRNGPVGLSFSGAPALGSDPAFGPAILPA